MKLDQDIVKYLNLPKNDTIRKTLSDILKMPVKNYSTENGGRANTVADTLPYKPIEFIKNLYKLTPDDASKISPIIFTILTYAEIKTIDNWVEALKQKPFFKNKNLQIDSICAKMPGSSVVICMSLADEEHKNTVDCNLGFRQYSLLVREEKLTDISYINSEINFSLYFPYYGVRHANLTTLEKQIDEYF